MSTELATVGPAAVLAAIQPRNMQEYQQMCNLLAAGLGGKWTPQQLFLGGMVAMSEGRDFISVLKDYHFFDGQLCLKWTAVLDRHTDSGGTIEWHRHDEEEASATFTYKGTKFTSTWNTERAKRAGLTGKKNWLTYPEEMRISRCVTSGVRTVNPRVFGGSYTPDELGAVETEEAEVSAARGTVGDNIRYQELDRPTYVSDGQTRELVNGVPKEVYDAVVAEPVPTPRRQRAVTVKAFEPAPVEPSYTDEQNAQAPQMVVPDVVGREFTVASGGSEKDGLAGASPDDPANYAESPLCNLTGPGIVDSGKPQCCDIVAVTIKKAKNNKLYALIEFDSGVERFKAHMWGTYDGLIRDIGQNPASANEGTCYAEIKDKPYMVSLKRSGQYLTVDQLYPYTGDEAEYTEVSDDLEPPIQPEVVLPNPSAAPRLSLRSDEQWADLLYHLRRNKAGDWGGCKGALDAWALKTVTDAIAAGTLVVSSVSAASPSPRMLPAASYDQAMTSGSRKPTHDAWAAGVPFSKADALAFIDGSWKEDLGEAL